MAFRASTAARGSGAGRRSRQCISSESCARPLARALAGEAEGRVARRHARANADGAESARGSTAQGRVGAMAPAVPEPPHAATHRRAPRRALFRAVEGWTARNGRDEGARGSVGRCARREGCRSVLGLVGEGCGAEERRTRSLGESWGPLGEAVYGVLAPENVRPRSYILAKNARRLIFRRHEHQRADAFHDATVKRFAFRRWESVHNRILVRLLTHRHLECCSYLLHQTLERRADRHIARQEDVLVRAVVRVWKAHERGRLLERVYNARLLRQAWEAWKKRLRHQKKFEGLAAVQSSFDIFL